MASIGTQFVAIAKITEAFAADGTWTETVSGGVISTHVRSFDATHGNNDVTIYAGDRAEGTINDGSGTVKLEMSQDDPAIRALVGGHTLDSITKGVTEAKDDVQPYVRVAVCARAFSDGKANGYELTKLWYAKLNAADKSMKTKEKTVSVQYPSMSGDYYENCDGKSREVVPFATYAEAVTAAKTFAGIAAT